MEFSSRTRVESMREETWEKGKGSCMRDWAKGCPSGRTGPAMEKVCKTPQRNTCPLPSHYISCPKKNTRGWIQQNKESKNLKKVIQTGERSKFSGQLCNRSQNHQKIVERCQQGMIMHACNPSTWETKPGELSWVWGQPRQHTDN